MKLIRSTLCLFVAMFFFCQSMAAQNQVMVTVSISPPYSHRFADYTQYQNQVFLSLTNTTQQDLQMKVLCEITGQGSGFHIKTKPDYVPNQIITLAPGETRQFNGNGVTGYLDRNNTEDNIPGDVEADILRTGLLPQDVYDYCIEVVDINTLAVLGRRCTVIPIQYLTPPQPNLPWCGESQNLLNNPSVNFSWLPSTGGGMGNANLRYDFYIVPVPAGQDPAQLLDLAMDGQMPGQSFVIPDLVSTYLPYTTPTYPPLKPGTYVWGIVAHDLNKQVGIENDGKSQFCTLTLLSGDVDNEGVADQVDNAGNLDKCSCQSPPQAPGGPTANEILQVGTTIKVGAYDMYIKSLGGQGTGVGRISVPGFPGGLSLPVLVNFTGVTINSDRKMMTGFVTAQLKDDVGFLPEIANPNLATLPLGQDQITQLDNYFAQNVQQLVSSLGNMVDESGFQLPLGLDKYVGGQKVVVAITGLYFDATRAALDAAVVLNLVEAGTKIALSGRNICLKDGLGLCGEAELYLAENLQVPAINMALRGLKEAPQASQCTRVEFDKDGFKRLHIEALYTFSDQLLTKAAGGGPVVATLVADTEEGWSDWMASVTMDDFRIKGINDFTFRPGTSSYDHSTKTNPENMPADYTEGQTPTWTGFFLKTLQVDLPPIIRNRNSNQPLSGAATNVIIDGNGVTGTLSLNNLLAIGDGGNGNWQFSVDRFAVKFLKNTFQSGGFEGRLLLPITNRGVQSQLNYSSLLSYANNQFSYNFILQSKSDIEVDLFAMLFELYNTSTITVSYTAQNGFNANANLDGKFSINTKTFASELPEMQLAHLEFTDFELTTNHPYVKYGQLNAGLASPPKSVGGFPFSVNGWAIISDGNGIGLQANINLKLAEVGFLPNATTTIAFYGNIDQNGPKFNKFALKKFHVNGDFSVLHIDGDLEFFSRDGTWGDGFTGNMNTRFPPNITLGCRMQVGNKNGQNYWYVDGQSDFKGKKSEFLAGLNAFGFSGGAFYNMSPSNFQVKSNISSSEDPASFTNPGQAPSGTGYVFDPGKCGIKASVVIGLPTKSLFNSNAGMEVVMNHSDGGVQSFRFNGAARMFGDPGSDGLAKGTLDVGYDFPHKIMVLGVGFGLDLPALPVKAQGWLGIYANGSNGDWHFKVGRPLGYGDENQRVKASIDAWAIKVSAIAYFQCGNYDVDGLPKQLPPLMSQIFPNYRNDYAKFANLSRAGANGDAILVGLSVGFTYRATYLIIYGQLDAETGFDLLLRKGVSCNGGPAGLGKDAWYGTGQFYIGMAVSLGITIDLFFISGDFEILKIGFGGLLEGGGPNPTWMKGTVGGFYSILGGLVEGHAKFDFAVGERCIDASDALSKIKIFNDVSPETIAPDDPMVSDSQSVLVAPAAATNLRIGRTFALDQTLPNGDTLLRVFCLRQSDLGAEFTKMDGGEVKFETQFSDDEFGISLNKSAALTKRTWYKVKFMASLSECPANDVVSLGRTYYGQPDGYCSSSNWQTAKIKDKNTGKVNDFKEIRELRFVTNDGLDSIPPECVIYTIPHRGQRFFCHWDMAQVLIALNTQLPASAFKAPDGAVPVIKMRFVPSGMSDDEALPAGDVTLMDLPYDDPALAVKNVFGNYVATKGKYYYLGQQPGGLLSPNTTYGIQYFLEWPKAPNGGGGQQQQNVVKTVVSKRFLAAGQGAVNQRELTAQKYALGKNQHQIYRYYFRTSSYPTFARKMEGLELKELIVKELLWGASTSIPRKTISILPPEVEHADQIVARIKAEFSPAHWSGTNAYKGIYIPGANFDGPENFDVFDVKGFETSYMDNIYKKSVKVLPLIDLDNSLTRTWWRDFMFETLMILGYNGIKENVPYDKFPNWSFTAQSLKVNRVAGPISENAALGNIGGPPASMAAMIAQIGQQNGIQAQYNNSLVEVFRFILDASLDLPGTINPKNQILGSIIKNQWISDPTPINVDQWSTNIGVAYDHLSHAGGPGFNLQNIGSSLGPLKVNAIQPAGVQINTINMGKKR